MLVAPQRQMKLHSRFWPWESVMSPEGYEDETQCKTPKELLSWLMIEVSDQAVIN